MTLGSHQTSIGKSQVAITPRAIVDAIGPFDLDPCAADPRPWACAAINFIERDDGLSLPWFGRVWLNPPFDRRVIARWVMRMVGHGCGTALLHARTETDWFWPIWETASALLFLRRRVRFHQPDGSLFLNSAGEPKDSGAPVVLIGFGDFDAEVLSACGLDGKFVPLLLPTTFVVAALRTPTWREVVADFLHSRGRASTDEIFRFIAAHRKTRGNNHVRAKLRQTLNGGDFDKTADGWGIA